MIVEGQNITKVGVCQARSSVLPLQLSVAYEQPVHEFNRLMEKVVAVTSSTAKTSADESSAVPATSREPDRTLSHPSLPRATQNHLPRSNRRRDGGVSTVEHLAFTALRHKPNQRRNEFSQYDHKEFLKFHSSRDHRR